MSYLEFLQVGRKHKKKRKPRNFLTELYRQIGQLKVKLELLTTGYDVVMISIMKAQLMIKTRRILSEISFAEVVVWKLPNPIKGSKHLFKYRLAFVVEGVCVLRYDNESSKGDHRHMGEIEIPYEFTTPEQLLADFWKDIDNWRQ